MADLWRIRRVHFSRGLKWIRPGSARTQPRTQKSTADPPRIRHRYAAEPWTKSPPKKLKKSASPPNESESVRRGLFLVLADYFGGQESDSPLRIRRGSAGSSKTDCQSTQKVHRKKPIFKTCKWTSGGLRQCGLRSADLVHQFRSPRRTFKLF